MLHPGSGVHASLPHLSHTILSRATGDGTCRGAALMESSVCVRRRSKHGGVSPSLNLTALADQPLAPCAARCALQLALLAEMKRCATQNALGLRLARQMLSSADAGMAAHWDFAPGLAVATGAVYPVLKLQRKVAKPAGVPRARE